MLTWYALPPAQPSLFSDGIEEETGSERKPDCAVLISGGLALDP